MLAHLRLNFIPAAFFVAHLDVDDTLFAVFKTRQIERVKVVNLLDPVFPLKMQNRIQQTAQNFFTARLVEYPLKREIIKYRIGFQDLPPLEKSEAGRPVCKKCLYL